MKLPKLGDSISDATIFKYHKSNNNIIYVKNKNIFKRSEIL
jgi:hypothetical protein